MSVSFLYCVDFEPIVFVEPKEKSCCFYAKNGDYLTYLSKDYKVYKYDKKFGDVATAAELTSQRLQSYILNLLQKDSPQASAMADHITMRTSIDLKAYFSNPVLLKHSQFQEIVSSIRAILREMGDESTLIRSRPVNLDG